MTRLFRRTENCENIYYNVKTHFDYASKSKNVNFLFSSFFDGDDESLNVFTIMNNLKLQQNTVNPFIKDYDFVRKSNHQKLDAFSNNYIECSLSNTDFPNVGRKRYTNDMIYR